jgi:hypothetical protein
MKRKGLVGLSVGVAVVLLIVWVARNSYWAEVTMPLPPKGEALTNPFYAAQRFAEALGAHTVRDRQLGAPRSDAVIVLSAWNWSLSHTRRQALERWVESGGRLVVDRTVIDGEDDFERWSGIVEAERERGAGTSARRTADRCVPLREEHRSAAASPGRSTYDVCSVDEAWSLTSERNATWSLRGASGIQAIRVPVGRGSVTMINANPFRYRYLLDGDHARLLVAATQLQRADEVHFLSEDNAPWLLTLAWQHGAPVITMLCVIVALALWRGVIRFGPLAAPDHAARRSLAEQIRGTGRFALLHGGGESLHAACVRALDEAVRRRLKTYSGLGIDDRAEALASITGFNKNALAAAIQPHSTSGGSSELRRTIAFLETARRHILSLRELERTGGTTITKPRKFS